MFTPLVGDNKLRWLLPNFELMMHQMNSENHTSNKCPNHLSTGFPDQSVLGPSSW